MNLHVSRFNNRHDNQPKEVNITWANLVKELTKFRIRDDHDGELWSPGRYLQGARRSLENVLDLCLIVLDFDDGALPEDMRKLWDELGLEYVIHSSWHNQLVKRSNNKVEPAHPRWRAIFPLQRPMIARGWGKNYSRIAEYLAPGAWCSACKNPNRVYWLPSAPNNDHTFAEHVPGRLFDPDEAPAIEEVEQPEPENEGNEDGDKDRLQDALDHIPSDDYDVWLRVGMALKFSLGDKGKAVWDKWSKDADNYDEEEIDKKWVSFKEVAEDKVREGTIYRFAMQNGWQPPLKSVDGGGEKRENVSLDGELSKLLRTEADNAERLFRRYGTAIRYLSQSKRWLVWDGARWENDQSGRIFEAAKASNRAILKEAYKLPDDQISAHTKWAVKSLSANNIRNTLSLTQSLVPISPGDLDSDPMLLNLDSGTVDLTTGEQRPHKRSDMVTKLAPISYDPTASCERWESFLDVVTGGDAELQAFLQRAVGYTLTGDISEQCLFLCYGTGANGKSVFLSTLRTLMGEYARQADFNTFLEIKTDGPRNDLARLHGSRLVTAAEPDPGKPLAESVIKSLTGDDTITARFLYGENFEFDPAFKIWLAANHKPRIRGQDEGIWRRLKLIPFTVMIPKEDRDKHLSQKLRDELPGILSWAIDGCLSWQQSGLKTPQAVVEASREYREEENILGDFLAQCCVELPTLEISASALYKAYKEYCNSNGTYQHSQKKFGGTLTSIGYRREKRGGKCLWNGLQLKRQEQDL